MAIPKPLLALLRCPQTGQSIRPMSADELKRINADLKSQDKQAWNKGLSNEDGSCFYPLADGIPVMLVEESIKADTLSA